MKERPILVLVAVGVQTSMSESGRIQSKSATQSYRDNFDATFPKKDANATLN